LSSEEVLSAAFGRQVRPERALHDLRFRTTHWTSLFGADPQPNREKDSPMWNREDAVKREELRKPERVQGINPALAAEERRVVAWVGKSVVFKGTLTSSEDLTIDGHVEGTIEVRGQGLTVGPDADIRAEIVATTATIHGTVIGNIHASEKVDIRATGHIEGDVIAPRIVIAEGAVVCGRIDTSTDATKLRAQLAIV
jgi:cytoskeletal protein CcmA (bactofilin family)